MTVIIATAILYLVSHRSANKNQLESWSEAGIELQRKDSKREKVNEVLLQPSNGGPLEPYSVWEGAHERVCGVQVCVREASISQDI